MLVWILHVLCKKNTSLIHLPTKLPDRNYKSWKYVVITSRDNTSKTTNSALQCLLFWPNNNLPRYSLYKQLQLAVSNPFYFIFEFQCIYIEFLDLVRKRTLSLWLPERRLNYKQSLAGHVVLKRFLNGAVSLEKCFIHYITQNPFRSNLKVVTSTGLPFLRGLFVVTSTHNFIYR